MRKEGAKGSSGGSLGAERARAGEHGGGEVRLVLRAMSLALILGGEKDQIGVSMPIGHHGEAGWHMAGGGEAL